MEPIPTSVPEPLSTPRPDDQLESNEQPSTICGFTLTEVAHVTIQVAGVIIAAVFGAWAIKSYESANVANRLSENSILQSNAANQLARDALQQSLYANILAIMNLCVSDQFRNSTGCAAVLQEAPFASIIHGVIPTLSSITQTLSTFTKTITLLPTVTTKTAPSPSPPTVGPPTVTTAPTVAPSPSISVPPVVTTTSTRLSPSSSNSSSIRTITRATATTLTATFTGTPSSTPDSSSAALKIPFGTVVGIIVAVVVAVASFCLLLIRYRRAMRSRF